MLTSKKHSPHRKTIKKQMSQYSLLDNIQLENFEEHMLEELFLTLQYHRYAEKLDVPVMIYEDHDRFHHE